jgi:hypothetical protein
MRKHTNNHNPNDDRTRRYVALLLVTPYALLILATPFVPGTREALAILGPFVGYAVRYLFETRRSDADEE